MLSQFFQVDDEAVGMMGLEKELVMTYQIVLLCLLYLYDNKWISQFTNTNQSSWEIAESTSDDIDLKLNKIIRDEFSSGLRHIR